MKRAILIRPGGYIDPYIILENTELNNIQTAVGGNFQIVPVNLPNLSFFCNENGIAEELEYNMLASMICSYGFEYNHCLLGNVLVMGDVDDEGETRGLTVEQVGIFLHAQPDLLNQLIDR